MVLSTPSLSSYLALLRAQKMGKLIVNMGIPIFLLLTQLLALPLAAAKRNRGAGVKVPAIIVFGDSSVDTGNNNVISTVLKSNFEPYGRDFPGGRPTGRFCNGRISTDFISEAYGLKPTIPAYLDPMYNISDFASGVCFASAGTGYDTATSAVLSVIPLMKEVEYYKDYQKKLRAYLGTKKANVIIRNSLYILSIGTNDFLENYYTLPRRRSQFTVGQYSDFLIGLARNFIMEIYSLGVRKISLTGLPPMGCLPLERSTNIMNGNECVENYNNVALEFNEKMNNLAICLNKELAGMKAVLSNPYYIFEEMIQKPSSFGFEETARACCGTGMFEMSYLCGRFSPFTCSDASKYVFWDSFHPTEKSHRIIIDRLLPKLFTEFPR